MTPEKQIEKIKEVLAAMTPDWEVVDCYPREEGDSSNVRVIARRTTDGMPIVFFRCLTGKSTGLTFGVSAAVTHKKVVLCTPPPSLREYGLEVSTIRFSLHRGAKALAHDIERRFVAPFEPVWRRYKERVKQTRENEVRQTQEMNRLRKIFHQPAKSVLNRPEPQSRQTVSNGEFGGPRIEIEFNYDGTRTIEFNGMSQAEAEALARWYAELGK